MKRLMSGRIGRSARYMPIIACKALLVALMLGVTIQPTVGAYPGLANDRGYFTGAIGSTDFNLHESVLPWAAGCSFARLGGPTWNNTIAGNYNSLYMALPLDRSGGTGGNKVQFRDYLQGQYSSTRCGNWTRIGVAFIVHTMLGHTPNRSSTLSSADWTEFNTRIVNDASVVMRYNSSVNPVPNSYGRGFMSSGGTQDGYFYDLAGAQGEPLYSFSSTAGYNYSIKLRCANPAGNITPNIIVNPPVGRIESATCQRVVGWAYDADRPAQSLWVTLYIDGGYVGAYQANLYRPDVNSAYGITGNHGYSIDLGNRIINGAPHVIEVVARGINSSGVEDGRNTLLGRINVAACYDYSLQPTAVSATGSVVAAGQPVSFTYNVAKTGTTISQSAAVSIKEYIIPPGAIFNQYASALDGMSDCDARLGAGACTSSRRTYQLPSRVFTLSSTTVDGSGSNPVLSPIDTTSLSSGTRVCHILTLDPAAQTPTGTQVRNRWSPPACVTVGKKPYLTAINGDIWSGGVFADSNGVCTVPAAQPGVTGSSSVLSTGRTYGAYSEYGLMSLHDITDFGSAGKPRSGIGLTFSNLASPRGNFSSATNYCLADALAYYGGVGATTISGAGIGVGGFSSGTYQVIGDATLNASELPVGRRVVLIVNGNVRINGNITYQDAVYNRLADIPSLVLIASGNIDIGQAATRLDGFYQSRGYLNTCAEAGVTGPIGLNSGVCQQPLVVQGAVITGRLVARRIAGADPALQQQAAERFVLRPDIFLSLYSQSQVGGRARTVGENELPPRY